MAVDDDVLALVAAQITAGARELRGALHRLQAMSAAFDEPITRELADEALRELARHCTRPVRLADVEKVVCEVFGVEPAQLRSDRKGRSVSEPRMLAMWLARKYTRAPWSEIGEFFGRRSHSTVISAHRRVEKLISDAGGDRAGRSAVPRGRSDPAVGDGAADGVSDIACCASEVDVHSYVALRRDAVSSGNWQPSRTIVVRHHAQGDDRELRGGERQQPHGGAAF